MGPNTLKIYCTIFRFPDVIQNFLALYSTIVLFVDPAPASPPITWKQTIYGNIVFFSTLTFNNLYIITLFPTYGRNTNITDNLNRKLQSHTYGKKATYFKFYIFAWYYKNLRQPPPLAMLPPSQRTSINLWYKFTAADCLDMTYTLEYIR